MSLQAQLTGATLADGVRELTSRDADLAQIIDRDGFPPLWPRPEGFSTLVHIILEQQVSLASASALFQRLQRELPRGITPAGIRAVGCGELQALGVTRQKSRYVCALADAVATRALVLRRLRSQSDEEVARSLMCVPGIGPWTASIYLLMALRRPDVWPVGDLALHRMLVRLRERSEPLTSQDIQAAAEKWRPWRAVAARILWHGYLAAQAGRRRPDTAIQRRLGPA